MKTKKPDIFSLLGESKSFSKVDIKIIKDHHRLNIVKLLMAILVFIVITALFVFVVDKEGTFITEYFGFVQLTVGTILGACIVYLKK